MATIIKRGENSYRITVYKDNKKYRKTVKARSKTEAKKKAAIYEAQLVIENEKEYSEMMMAKFAQKWIDRKRNEIEANTLTSYKRNLNSYILPRFGGRKISSLKPIEFVDYYTELKNETDLGGRSINMVHSIMNIMFNDAVKWGLIEYNPLRRVDAPKYKRKSENYYDLDQVKILLNKMDEKEVMTKYRVAVYTALFCGLRAGEIIGLEWKDIDFDENVLTIKRSTIYTAGKIITKEPKNDSSIRQVYFGEVLRKEFLKHKENQELLKEVVSDWKDSGRVLTKNDGDVMFPQTPGQWFRKFIKRNNLDKITFHGLRHTAATLMITNGTDVRTVAERLGHSNANTTTKIYSHHLKRANKKAALDLEKSITQVE